MSVEVHFCTECGYKMEDNYEFCPNCGVRIDGAGQKSNIPDEKTYSQSSPPNNGPVSNKLISSMPVNNIPVNNIPANSPPVNNVPVNPLYGNSTPVNNVLNFTNPVNNNFPNSAPVYQPPGGTPSNGPGNYRPQGSIRSNPVQYGNPYGGQPYGNPYMQQGMQKKKSNKGIIIAISIIGALLLIALGYFMLKPKDTHVDNPPAPTSGPTKTPTKAPTKTPTTTPKDTNAVSDAGLGGMWKGTMKAVEVKKNNKPVDLKSVKNGAIYLKMTPGEKGKGELSFGIDEEPTEDHFPYTYNNGKLVFHVEADDISIDIIANITQKNDTPSLKGNLISSFKDNDGNELYLNWAIEAAKQ